MRTKVNRTLKTRTTTMNTRREKPRVDDTSTHRGLKRRGEGEGKERVKGGGGGTEEAKEGGGGEEEGKEGVKGERGR